MSYNPSIPGPNDLISVSQADILNNFSQLNTIFGQDHVKYDDATAANRGKHNQSTYPDSSSDPDPDPNELALYSKDVGGNSRLFLQQENSGTVIQLSGDDPVIALTEGFIFLYGGLLMKWGQKDSPGTSGSVAFTTGSFPNTIFQVQLTLQHEGAGAETYTVQGTPVPTLSGFNYTTSSSGASSKLNWIALGN